MARILVSPAAYKGSIAASTLASAIAATCRQFFAACDLPLEVLEVPLADGGDDTILSLYGAIGGEIIKQTVVGPTGRPVEGIYLRYGDRAVVELASASGIAYLDAASLDATGAHTFGTGQMIAHAIAGGARQVIITLGGSASTDGGTGALAALGARFLDGQNRELELGGGALGRLVAIDCSVLKSRVEGVEFTIATDVTSPLTGPAGAAAIFGPQKGADPAAVSALDQGLERFAAVVEATTGQSPALRESPGAGAAGGSGFGLASLLPARIVSGFHYLADLLELGKKVAWCDLLIVAEGKLDNQSLTGKGVGEIINLAALEGKAILAVPAVSEIAENALPVGQLKIVSAAELSASGLATLKEVDEAVRLGLSFYF